MPHQSNQFEYINQYYKIPLIKLIKTKIIIEYKCENGHKDEVNL